MIAIVDYGMGNLRSVQKAFEKVGAEALVTSYAKDIKRADKVVLPGVGAFGAAVRELEKRKLTPAILDAIESGRPFLGICLGLQLLFTESFEDGRWKGLGVIKGKVEKLPDTAPGGEKLKVPHIGWSKVSVVKGNALLEGVAGGDYFYFVHSYAAFPEEDGITSLTASYGTDFAAMVNKGNVYATQFHPEKSQEKGLRIIENFSKL